VAVAAQERETLNLSIITPEGEAFTGEIQAAIVTTTAGTIEVLPGHEALLSVLAPGPLVLRLPGSEGRKAFTVAGGFIQVKNEDALVLADALKDAAVPDD